MALVTEYWILDGIIILLYLIIIAYHYMTRNFDYWKKRGVLEIPPTPFFGNCMECLFLQKAPSYFLKELYERKKDEPYIGFYIFDKPFLLLRDRKVIQHVLTADSNFDNRYTSADPKDRICYANLFFMEDPPQSEWTVNLARFFLNDDAQENMFDLMLECGKHLDKYLNSLELDSNGQLIDIMDVSSKFTIDVIWSIAFGRDVNTFQNPNSDYSRHTKMMLENNYMRTWKMLAMFFLPNLTRFRKLKVFDEETIVFLRKIFWETMTKRVESDEERYDLIDTLIEIKWNVYDLNYIESLKLRDFDDDDLLAQAASFFLLGFETTSTTAAFALYELALQPEIQSTLRKEIFKKLEKSSGNDTYTMIRSLPYLDMVVSETLRKYPSLGFLNRMAKQNSEVPERNLVIEKGTPVYISVLGLHYDPKYFPDPDIFDPERFNEENKRNRPSCVYVPFGRGRRSCIAENFGLVQTKLALLKILSKYEVTPCEKTSIPVEIDPKGPMTVPLNNELYLKVQKINTNAI